MKLRDTAVRKKENIKLEEIEKKTCWEDVAEKERDAARFSAGDWAVIFGAMRGSEFIMRGKDEDENSEDEEVRRDTGRERRGRERISTMMSDLSKDSRCR